MIFIALMVTLTNLAKADTTVQFSTVDQCENLAVIVMNGDLSDESKEVKEMEALECNELGDFFN